jgi:hypothetical protein
LIALNRDSRTRYFSWMAEFPEDVRKSLHDKGVGSPGRIRTSNISAKTGEKLDNARELQASWDRVLLFRVPLLVVSLLAQWLALLVASA